jgi:hypothetical protein
MATMLAEPQKLEPQKLLEDPLAYLPCSSILEYRKGSPEHAVCQIRRISGPIYSQLLLRV